MLMLRLFRRNHVDDLDKYLAKEDKTNEDKESYHQNLEKVGIESKQKLM